MGLFSKKTSDSKTETTQKATTQKTTTQKATTQKTDTQKTTTPKATTQKTTAPKATAQKTATSAVQNLVQKATQKVTNTMQSMPNGDYLPIQGKVINDSHFNATFTAEPSKGNRLNIAAENYSDSPVTLIVKENDAIVQKIQLAKSKGTVFKASITEPTTYAVQLTSTTNENFSTFIKARLFKE